MHSLQKNRCSCVHDGRDYGFADRRRIGDVIVVDILFAANLSTEYMKDHFFEICTSIEVRISTEEQRFEDGARIGWEEKAKGRATGEKT